jgi:hypothetical protein
MNLKPVMSEIYKWLIIGALGALVLLSTALANRNVYTKEGVDAKVEAVQEIHNRDFQDTQRQLNRIEGNVDKLVDKLIEEG